MRFVVFVGVIQSHRLLSDHSTCKDKRERRGEMRHTRLGSKVPSALCEFKRGKHCKKVIWQHEQIKSRIEGKYDTPGNEVIPYLSGTSRGISVDKNL